MGTVKLIVTLNTVKRNAQILYFNAVKIGVKSLLLDPTLIATTCKPVHLNLRRLTSGDC